MSSEVTGVQELQERKSQAQDILSTLPCANRIVPEFCHSWLLFSEPFEQLIHPGIAVEVSLGTE